MHFVEYNFCPLIGSLIEFESLQKLFIKFSCKQPTYVAQLPGFYVCAPTAHSPQPRPLSAI